MPRPQEWFEHFALLEVTTSGWAGRQPVVRVRYGSGAYLVGMATLAVGTLSMFIAGVMMPGLWRLMPFAPTLALLLFLAALNTRKLVLREPVLAQAAARAAEALGRERAGRWTIHGAQARAIGADLIRLRKLPLPLPSEKDPTQAREEQLLQAAGPELRRFLQPVLTTDARNAEPDAIEVTNFTEGEPWPMLNPPESPLEQD